MCRRLQLGGFLCKGALPQALQKVNEMIYTEWLTATKDSEFAAGYCVEYYGDPMNYENGTADETITARSGFR